MHALTESDNFISVKRSATGGTGNTHIRSTCCTRCGTPVCSAQTRHVEIIFTCFISLELSVSLRTDYPVRLQSDGFFLTLRMFISIYTGKCSTDCRRKVFNHSLFVVCLSYAMVMIDLKRCYSVAPQLREGVLGRTMPLQSLQF